MARKAKTENYIAVFTSNGAEHARDHYPWMTLAQARTLATGRLARILEQHHGRGDHSVAVYLSESVNVTTPEMTAVGVAADWQDVCGPLVFSL